MKGGFMNLNSKNNTYITDLLNRYETKYRIMTNEDDLFFIDYTENDLNKIYENLLNILSYDKVQERLKSNKELAKVFLEDMIQSFYYKIQYLQNISPGYILRMQNNIIKMFDNLFGKAVEIFGEGEIIKRLNYIYTHLGITKLIATQRNRQERTRQAERQAENEASENLGQPLSNQVVPIKSFKEQRLPPNPAQLYSHKINHNYPVFQAI